MDIEIDFEVFKALTARRKHERHTYNDVLRELLGLDPVLEDEAPAGSLPGVMSQLSDHLSRAILATPGTFMSRGLRLPDGTQLRAKYKGKQYRAEIVGGQWVDENGEVHSSPSAAATRITQTTVNGWRFWEARRPQDTEWLRLDLLV